MDWIYKDKQRDTTKNYDSRTLEAKRADQDIKFCPVCELCYEKYADSYNKKHLTDAGKKLYVHYEDFPSYGKQVKICPACKTKKENKNGEKRLDLELSI